LIGFFKNFMPVAEVAQIRQEAAKKPRRPFQQFFTTKEHDHVDFSGISL